METCIVDRCDHCQAIRGLIPVERPVVESDGLCHLLEFFLAESLCDRVVGGLHSLLSSVSQAYPHLRWHRVWRCGDMSAFGAVVSDPSFPGVVGSSEFLPQGNLLCYLGDGDESSTITGMRLVVK
jgi:hypothetical protein